MGSWGVSNCLKIHFSHTKNTPLTLKGTKMGTKGTVLLTFFLSEAFL